RKRPGQGAGPKDPDPLGPEGVGPLDPAQMPVGEAARPRLDEQPRREAGVAAPHLGPVADEDDPELGALPGQAGEVDSGHHLRGRSSARGEPVLFVNGTGGPGAYFAPLLGALHGFRCLVLDRPGWGLGAPVDFSGRPYRTVV